VAVPEEADRLMRGRLLAMLLKEFRQLAAEWPIVLILLWGFFGAVFLAGHAGAVDLNNYPVVVMDLSHSNESRELVSRLRAPYFKIVRLVHSDREVVETLDAAGASLAVIIPPGFARDVQESRGRFQVISDGTQAQMATLAAAYIAQIAGQYGVELLERRVGPGLEQLATLPQVDARVRIEFNPSINTAWFSSLFELFNMITMTSLLLTSAALVREKEHGTLEQLLVSPLRPAELFAAKIIPTVIVVLLLSPLSLYAIVHGVHGTPLRGSVLLFYAVTSLYVFSIASLGLTLAVIARNLPQAMMLMFLTLWPMMFLSGAMSPPESMAPWMQYLSLLSPMRYYIDLGFQVLFKGNSLAYVWQDILGILVLGSGLFAFAVWRFRRLL
jgi:ABC-2 type transport system permease protein